MADMLDTQMGMDTQGPDSAELIPQVIQFYLNGTMRTSSSPPLTRLSDVLRDELGLKGTKIGCSAGDCGLCTVRNRIAPQIAFRHLGLPIAASAK